MSEYFKDYKHRYSYEFDKGLTICTARSRVQIKKRCVPVKGIGEAKCDSVDIYDEEFGKELSKIRAKKELCQKIENAFIDETKKKEWRKESLIKLIYDSLCRLLK